MNDKILIFGTGQIGTLYKSHFETIGIETHITKTDIRNAELTEKEISEINPTVIINAAAKTNLEWCANNKLEAFEVNVLGADNLAQICDKKGIYFIHISSGCIFESKDENDTKREEDTPHPAAYYSLTKAWSEQLIELNKSKDFKYLIIRPRQPISAQFNYKNTLVKMLTCTKFIDTPNTVTILEDLMKWTATLIEQRATGLLNVANKGWTTPYQEALLLKKHILPNLEIEKISKEELDKIMPNRRVDTVLCVDRLESIVGKVRSTQEALEELIIELGKNIRNMPKEDIKYQLDKAMEQSRARTVVNNQWPQLIDLGK